MEWTDIGIVLGARRHGEANAVVELMTRGHGRHLGLVRGGAGSRLKPVLQAGNRVSATWRARLDEHLGYYVVEAIDLRAAAFLSAAHALYGLNHLAALCRLLPERDPHAPVFDLLDHAIARLGEPASAAALVARFELHLLAELGFGLDLESCAVTGSAADLVYVSPKSGRAVSRGPSVLRGRAVLAGRSARAVSRASPAGRGREVPRGPSPVAGARRRCWSDERTGRRAPWAELWGM